MENLLAQVQNPILRSEYRSLLRWSYFSEIAPELLRIVFLVAAVVFIFIFLVGAFEWITAGADKGKLESARGRIVNAIVGLLILLLVWLIVQFINFVLGINIGLIGGLRTGSGETSPAPSGAVTNTIAYGCECSLWTKISDNCPADSEGSCSGQNTCTCLEVTVAPQLCTDIGGVCQTSCDPGTSPSTEPFYCPPSFLCCVEYNLPTDTPTPPGPSIPPTNTPTPEVCEGMGGVCLASCGVGCSTSTETYFCPSNQQCCFCTPTPTTPFVTSPITLIPTDPPTLIPTSVQSATQPPTQIPSPTAMPLPTATPTVIAFCSDSDAGITQNIFGWVTENTSNFPNVTLTTDMCSGPNSLDERYCSGNLLATNSASCPFNINTCQGGRCCAPPTYSCLADLDCCSGYICQSNTCRSSSNVFLNSTELWPTVSKSCELVCFENGYTALNNNRSNVDSVGTNFPSADNRQAMVTLSGACAVRQNIFVNTVMLSQSGICAATEDPTDFHRTMWTYCRCFSTDG